MTGHAALLLAALLVALGASAPCFADELDEEPTPAPDERPAPVLGSEAIPVRFVERQLITAHRNYELFVDLPLRRDRAREAQLGLLIGARHGFGRDFELGMTLWPIIFEQGLDLASPSVMGTYRVLRRPGAELGLHARVAFPLLGPDWSGEAALPLLLRPLSWMRLDLGPRFATTTHPTPSRPRNRLWLPASASVQLAAPVYFTARVAPEVVVKDAFRVAAGGDLVFSIGGERGADVDLGVSFMLLSLFERGRTPRLSGEEWAGTFTARFYFLGEINPLDEDF